MPNSVRTAMKVRRKTDTVNSKMNMQAASIQRETIMVAHFSNNKTYWQEVAPFKMIIMMMGPEGIIMVVMIMSLLIQADLKMEKTLNKMITESGAIYLLMY